MRRVFLNPDGTSPTGLAVIVAHSTGVEYGTQCAGLRTELRWAEGYLVPCPDAAPDSTDAATPKPSAALMRFFRANCRGGGEPPWGSALTDELATIVRCIPFWYTGDDGEDRRGALELDRARIGDTVEAWVPVTTPVGPGTLVFDNSD